MAMAEAAALAGEDGGLQSKGERALRKSVHRRLATLAMTALETNAGDPLDRGRGAAWRCCGETMNRKGDVHRHLSLAHAHCVNDAADRTVAVVR